MFFFVENLVLVSWQAKKLDFISQPSSQSTLPFAGLQHMQQCQVNFHLIFAPGFWSKWMVPEKWSPQWGGLNPQPLSCESSALTTRLLLLIGSHIFHLLHFSYFVTLEFHSKCKEESLSIQPSAPGYLWTKYEFWWSIVFSVFLGRSAIYRERWLAFIRSENILKVQKKKN